MSRFYVDKNYIGDTEIVLSDKDDFAHLTKVLRLTPKDELIICDGIGIDYKCSVKEIKDKSITFNILDKANNKNELPVNVTLYQGIPKLDKMDLIVQKCTELGITKIVPLDSEFTVAKLNDEKSISKKLERWNKIAKEASKQCNRGIISEVLRPLKFKDAVKDAMASDLKIIPYEKCYDKGLKKLFSESYDIKNIAIFIGPEGGFSEEEIRTAQENNIVPVSLGNRILRTETAPIAAMSIIMYNYEL